MGKSSQYTDSWFLERGYTFNPADGSWTPPTIKKGFIGHKKGLIIESEPINENVKCGITTTSINTKYTYTVLSESTQILLPKDSVLVINGLVAGLNGSQGLMRGHWAKIKKQKEVYQTIISQHLRENKIKQHLGEVTIEYIGYKSRFMDWDNFCASFKHIGDSLVKCKIIADDSPKIITKFIPSQIKVPQIDQKVIVIIKDV